jgi:hypothetical protein
MSRSRPHPLLHTLLFSLALAVVLAGVSSAALAKEPPRRTHGAVHHMSSMGEMAAKARAAVEKAVTVGRLTGVAQLGDGCDNQPDCGDDSDGPAGGQAEVSIAVDSTGKHIVIGFNDTRGFANNPVSVSGYMYSDDGGVTFVDGGQLPSPGTDTIGTTRLPQVFGDPEVKYMGGCNFIYSSIVVAKFSPTRTVQTMGVHRSTDCGHSWTGPFVVGPASNPHGQVSGTGSPRDAADKEFMDVDPDTGRVLLSWSNFTPFSLGGVEISTTYSDDIMTGTPPTWSARQIVAATAADGQSSIPRFAGRGSSNAYVAWRRFPFPGTFGGNGNTIGFVRSTDNGASWSAPIELGPEFFTMDQVLGNDRVNTAPSLAVDNSRGDNRGNVYVIYQDNDGHDGADIVFQRSTDGGLTFSAPVAINSRPGNDRAQWNSWITVDRDTGRIWAFYYDQGIAANGDLTETTVTFSDDTGRHWSAPEPLTDRPWHAGWGNDTGQPNLGDYNEAVAQGGELFAAFGATSRPPAGFADGQPTSANMTTPDVFFRRVPGRRDGEGDHGDGHGDVAQVKKVAAKEGDGHGGGSPVSRATNSLPVSLSNLTFTESGGNGNIDPGDTVRLKIELRNYVTNSIASAATIHEASARLSTATPGVTVVRRSSDYRSIAPGGTATNQDDFVLQVASTFVPGTPIELVLQVQGEERGSATLLRTLFTGTPSPTVIFSEDFNSVAPGALPAGWTTSHAGGANTVPWTTSASFCGATSNAAFHQNAADGPGPGPFTNTRFERLFSPVFAVPANADYVTLDMDVCYDTEDDPNFNILAYDGFLIRLTDFTPGRLLRSELSEAFEDELFTGSFQHFPKHFPRSGNGNYFQDMSAWAGFSNGVQHVHMRLPGMAGSQVQLRFEFTQDSIGTCADVRPGHACGVSFDNVVVKSVVNVHP